MTTKHGDATERFKEALDKSDEQTYKLKLYVAGTTPKSSQAIRR